MNEERPPNDLRIIWECDKCGNQNEEPPGCNEGGPCHCGGNYYAVGESYDA